MDGYKIRPMEPGDAVNVTKLLNEVSEESSFLTKGPADPGYNSGFMYEYILMMKSNNDVGLVLTHNGDIVGVSMASCIHRTMSRLRHRCQVFISIHKNHRGLGLGKSLLLQTMKTCKAKGFETMELEVIKSNIIARYLYKRVGFVTYGVFKDAIKNENSYEDIVLMNYDLKGMEDNLLWDINHSLISS